MGDRGGTWERPPNPILGVRRGSGKAFHKKLVWGVCRVGWSDCVPPGRKVAECGKSQKQGKGSLASLGSFKVFNVAGVFGYR